MDKVGDRILFFCISALLGLDWFFNKEKKQIKLRDEIKLQLQEHSLVVLHIFAKMFHFRDGFGLGNLHGYPRYKIVGRTEEGKIFNSMS